MQDAILHYMRDQLRDPGLDGPGGGTRREQGAGHQQRADGHFIPAHPDGPNDYVYIMTSRANPSTGIAC